MEPLPSHRQLITSLISSISNIAPPTTAEDTSSVQPLRAAQHPTLSPLQTILPSQRPLLLTLHVLFPTLLLPALDLLDRGLVIRLLRNEELQDGISSDKIKNDMFLVRSLATTLSRRTRDFSSSLKRYVIHLDAWNCTCPSFTLDAFPAHAHSHAVSTTTQVQQLPTEDGQWSFGGKGIDPWGDAPPCCKHLLACLLVDKWSEMLGMYVEDRVVSKGEMAGIVADFTERHVSQDVSVQHVIRVPSSNNPV
ncbi:hypothetical protein CEK26_011149 [Fusarium fujikuroi]|nr:hypothetical protein CEK27_011166 [Fusarium fujikuroi]QGI84431.1 hypothetical protein CEK25_011160 [Fusarium fujikuroi]QGI98080.1 hypothetical protein CEK26_011149 [Fusarium fujikuroi]